MTKEKFLELIAPLDNDAEIMIEIDGELVPACNGDSQIVELVNEEDPEDSVLVAVIFPCYCAMDGDEIEEELNPELN